MKMMLKMFFSFQLTYISHLPRKIRHLSTQEPEINKVYRISLKHIFLILDNTDFDSETYPGGIINVPLIPGIEGTRETWRRAFINSVFPRLAAFQPDFILVSAGFDAHEYDHLHRPRETMITEFDFEWLTGELTKIANKFCHGRLVSVLEGGYNTNLGPLSPLAMSVQSHVRALINTRTPYIEI